MSEKKSYPNVSLGGRLSKQKGEVDSGHLRYGIKDRAGGSKNK